MRITVTKDKQPGVGWTAQTEDGRSEWGTNEAWAVFTLLRNNPDLGIEILTLKANGRSDELPVILR